MVRVLGFRFRLSISDLAVAVVGEVADVAARKKNEAVRDEDQGDVMLVELAVVSYHHSLMQAARPPVAALDDRKAV